MRLPNLQKEQGFTLVELLVVIAIIGLLSSIVLASLSGAKSSAQTASIMAENQEIQVAMELYYNTNGGYPNPDPGTVVATCIGGTDCQLAGVAVTQQLAFANKPPTFADAAQKVINPLNLLNVAEASLVPFSFPYATTPVVRDTAGLANKGFIYISCGSPAPVCAGATSYLLTIFNTGPLVGVNQQTVGLWQKFQPYSPSTPPPPPPPPPPTE